MGNSNDKILLETPMLESWFHTVTSVTSPPPSSNKFLRVVLFFLSKTETKNLLQEVHVIFTWCGVDPDMLDSNIFGTWFCCVATLALARDQGKGVVSVRAYK
jgi:hypothetical protein